MKIFISWSGERSREVAQALKESLPLILQYVDAFLSADDIDKGARWSGEIAAKLDACHYGVVCLTPENLDSAWIHFEAGALSKSVSAARVAPLLLELKKSEVTGPLSQFQLTPATKE